MELLMNCKIIHDLLSPNYGEFGLLSKATIKSNPQRRTVYGKESLLRNDP